MRGWKAHASMRAALAAMLAAATLSASAAFAVLPPPLLIQDLYGVVSDAESGARVSGVAVDLDRDIFMGTYEDKGSMTTNTSGGYGFSGVTNGLYALTFRTASTRYRSAVLTPPLFSGSPIRTDVALRRVAERVAGRTRYSTAVAVARAGYDPAGDKIWPGVTHVVIASGEDRAAADPLAASGLCWAYDAPLFLVSSTSVPPEVTQAIQEIVTARGTVTVHIVGGNMSVPDARFAELDAAVNGTLIKSRVLASGSRYDLAAKIAHDVMKRANEVASKSRPPAVLVANGADPAKFFDALALSPISAAKGCPIVLTDLNVLPTVSRNAITSLGFDYAIVGGGPLTVSNGVLGTVQELVNDEGGIAERWYGQSRYTTAIRIAEKAQAKGWLDFLHIGVAAKLPDALVGGSAVGRLGGVVVLTRGDVLSPDTAAFLERWDTHNNGALGNWSGNDKPVFHPSVAGATYVLGGKLSIADAVQTKMIDVLAIP